MRLERDVATLLDLVVRIETFVLTNFMVGYLVALHSKYLNPFSGDFTVIVSDINGLYILFFSL